MIHEPDRAVRHVAAALAFRSPGQGSAYFEREALLEDVESGAIGAISARWLVAHAAAGGRIMRRQDLPAEAFFTAAALRQLVKALGDDYGMLFVALSYRWLSKDHPDPDGFHLGIVAPVAKLYMKETGKSGSPRSPLTAAFDAKGLGAPDFALFCARPPGAKPHADREATTSK